MLGSIEGADFVGSMAEARPISARVERSAQRRWLWRRSFNEIVGSDALSEIFPHHLPREIVDLLHEFSNLGGNIRDRQVHPDALALTGELYRDVPSQVVLLLPVCSATKRSVDV